MGETVMVWKQKKTNSSQINCHSPSSSPLTEGQVSQLLILLLHVFTLICIHCFIRKKLSLDLFEIGPAGLAAFFSTTVFDK